MEYLYKKFARYYDLCYHDKDYSKETRFVQDLIRKHGIKGRSVLEVGIGTGGHAVYLENRGYDVFGIDLHKEMLAVARKKGLKVKQGDMRDFRLKRKFDIILCLFSTIHYNQNKNDLKKTIRNLYSHLKEGGILVFDMGFNEERFESGHKHLAEWSDGIDFLRFSKSRRKGNKAILDMGYIVYKKSKLHFGEDHHILGIFRTREVRQMCEQVSFRTRVYDRKTEKPWKGSKNYVVFACLKC